MRKIIITVLASILITSTAAFAGSIQIGATVSSAFVDASGEEKTTTGTVTGGAVNTNKASVENNFVTIPSIYAEYSLDDASYASEGNGITIGVLRFLKNSTSSNRFRIIPKQYIITRTIKILFKYPKSK